MHNLSGKRFRMMVPFKGLNLLFSHYLMLVLLLFIIICIMKNLSAEDSGGTDEDIEIFTNTGSGGDFTWNEVHGFQLKALKLLIKSIAAPLLDGFIL